MSGLDNHTHLDSSSLAQSDHGSDGEDDCDEVDNSSMSQG